MGILSNTTDLTAGANLTVDPLGGHTGRTTDFISKLFRGNWVWLDRSGYEVSRR